MKKNKVIEILADNGLAPVKKLGQNFLLDESAADRIVDAVEISPEDDVLEIGPGLGILTGRIAERAKTVEAVEIDAGMVRFLAKRFCGREGVSIVHMDFLKYVPARPFVKIVSNLPYYCASEMLFKILDIFPSSRVYVLVQKEMARRVVAGPGGKDYGALTVTMGVWYESRILFDVHPASFFPRPDVTSSFMALTPVESVPLDEGEKVLFHLIVKSAFWGRRKTLVKALTEAPHLSIERDAVISALKQMKLDEKVRGENLSVMQFMDLTGLISRYLNVQNEKNKR